MQGRKNDLSDWSIVWLKRLSFFGSHPGVALWHFSRAFGRPLATHHSLGVLSALHQTVILPNTL